MAKVTKTKGKVERRMRPFTREQLQLIRDTLKVHNRHRDLALFNTGVDTMLRAGDLVRMRVSDILDHKQEVITNFQIVQDKTETPVYVQLTPKTRAALKFLINHQEKYGDDYLFTRQGNCHGKHLSEVALRDLIKEWAAIVDVDPKHYSGHTLRRSKAVIIYRETRDAEVVRQLLGHASLSHTVAYLGVEKEDVAKVALRFDV